MAINNNTIETTKTTESFVIVVKRGNVKKFIARNWCNSSKGHIDCTVLINKSKKFSSEDEALIFYNDIKDLDRELSLVCCTKLTLKYDIIL